MEKTGWFENEYWWKGFGEVFSGAVRKWFLGKEIIQENNSSELYFEEENIEDFVIKLETLYPNIKYVNRLMTHSWGQKVIRFYDLDGNLIEVGTPIK